MKTLSAQFQTFSKTLLITCLLTGGYANASIIGPHTTAGGKSVNLSGLEWLELTPTQNYTRYDIEGGSGGWINDGWRYANRSETEALLDSLWGGTTEGVSADNFDGARWFYGNFGVSDVYGDGYSSGGGSVWTFHFGENSECDSRITHSCFGRVNIEDLDHADLPGNSTLGVNAGSFSDALGLSTGLTIDNTNVSQWHGRVGDHKGSLLVRTTDVSEPAILALFTVGFLGLGLARRHKTK
jgi:hypothetical protein